MCHGKLSTALASAAPSKLALARSGLLGGGSGSALPLRLLLLLRADYRRRWVAMRLHPLCRLHRTWEAPSEVEQLARDGLKDLDVDDRVGEDAEAAVLGADESVVILGAQRECADARRRRECRGCLWVAVEQLQGVQAAIQRRPVVV